MSDLDSEGQTKDPLVKRLEFTVGKNNGPQNNGPHNNELNSSSLICSNISLRGGKT